MKDRNYTRGLRDTLLGVHPELTAPIPKAAPFLVPQERGKVVGGPSFLRKVCSVAVEAATEGQGK